MINYITEEVEKENPSPNSQGFNFTSTFSETNLFERTLFLRVEFENWQLKTKPLTENNSI